jgi:hypothetical protein
MQNFHTPFKVLDLLVEWVVVELLTLVVFQIDTHHPQLVQ